MTKKLSVRLPPNIHPERYEIFLKPDLKDFVFEGEETIYLIFDKSTKEIILHSKDLEISEVKVRGKSKEVSRGTVSYDKKSETAVFKFANKIPAGQAELKIKFRGALTDKLKGFYRSRYEVNGEEKYIATTQFEATDARAAFPCFDEPAHKAVFDVTLMVPGHMTAISNTIETDIKEHAGGYKLVKFAPTPKMSTYLLAFIVGEFEHIEKKTSRGVLVRVFTTPGKKHQAKFALEVAAKALDFYEKYFDIPYPLPVLDLIAIPDFASAAMENWGAVTYRETALLVDEQLTSTANKQWVAIVIAHELAHQWFGNLVTMHWWTDLWLNEGFASYMEYLATDKLFPEWHMWDQYVSERFAVALKLDALQNTHPIEVEVHHPDEIWEIFDSVSYAKGSAVIRMLAGYLGEKDFREGLRHYLKKHKYGNTITQDLWAAFERVSKKPVVKLMQNWTKKAGHPLVSVSAKGKNLKLSQSRFFSSEVSRKKSADKTLWDIPLVSVDSRGHIRKELMQSKVISLPKQNPGWIKFNYGEVGVYRVEYDEELFMALEHAIKDKLLQPSDRLGVLRDAFNLSQAGQFSTVKALQMAEHFKNETELPVWEELASGVAGVEQLFMGEPWIEKYNEYAREIFRHASHKLGWENKRGESHTTVLLRTLLLAELGAFGDQETITKAKKMFWDADKGKSIPVDLRGLVYGLAAENGGQKEFDRLVSMYKSSGHHEEQDRIGRSMGRFKNPKILKQVIKFSLSGDVRLQDSPSIFIQVARNFYGRKLAWQYLKKNWKDVYNKYNTGGHLLEWFVSGFSLFKTSAEAKDIESFFKKNPAPAIARTVSQIIERVKSNEAWFKREQKNVGQWLNTS